MQKLLLILALVLFTACETVEIAEKNIEPTQLSKKMTGEWFYVGTFSHLADYGCIVCEGYDPEKAIYKMTFKEDGTLSGRINLLISQGKFGLKDTKEGVMKNMTGTIAITEFNFLNKPPQTQADTDFIEIFENASFVYIDVNSSKTYDILQLTSKNKSNSFIAMAKKK
jgi:Pyruvate/2-oxoacid:ferredoxin oxidoreductase delta subunit